MTSHLGLLRYHPGGARSGFDSRAVLELADVVGLARSVVVELLPAIEAGMIAGLEDADEDRG